MKTPETERLERLEVEQGERIWRQFNRAQLARGWFPFALAVLFVGIVVVVTFWIR